MDIQISEVLKEFGGSPSKPKIDYTGKVFGRWKVIGYPTRNDKYKVFWMCQCQCSNKTLKMIDRTSLKSGSSTSCGCSLKGLKSKYNDYDLSGEFGIGIAMNTGNKFYFDKEDYDLIKDYCWYQGSHGYMASTLRNDGVGHLLHKMITGTDSEEIIDHKDRNKLNCRKENLRISTYAQNGRNRSMMSNNTSGNTGIYWDKSKNKWCAEIILNYKKKFLGRFDGIEEATKVRKDAEIKYFKEYSNLQRYKD